MASKPIKIVGNSVLITQNSVVSLKVLSYLENELHYIHKTPLYWKNHSGKSHKKPVGSTKSYSAAHIINLRLQFRPTCCNIDNYDPQINDVVGLLGDSAQDYEYAWHFVHRHGFPSQLHGSGRGQQNKVRDIINHPLSYMLMCNVHHEQYDRETDEWRNPHNVYNTQ